MQVSNPTLTIKTEEFKQVLTYLKGEWGIFNSRRIMPGAKMQITSGPMDVWRTFWGKPRPTFQIAMTHTFTWWQGVNTVEGANFLKETLLENIQMTANLCGIALNYAVAAEEVAKEDQFEPLEARSVIELAKETFGLFSKARVNLSILRQTFAAEKESEHRTAYLSAYDAINIEADHVITELLGSFFAKVREGKLTSQIDLKKVQAKFQISDAVRAGSFEEAEFNLLDKSIKEFFQATYTLYTKLNEATQIFNSPEMKNDDAAFLRKTQCLQVRDVVTEFVRVLYEETREPLELLYQEHSLEHLQAVTTAFDRVFASESGKKFMAELTSINQTLTINTMTKWNDCWAPYLTKGSNLTHNPCWQACVFQTATSRLSMPLGEMMKQLQSFKAPQVALDPLIRISQQLEAMAKVAQTFNPGAKR